MAQEKNKSSPRVEWLSSGTSTNLQDSQFGQFQVTKVMLLLSARHKRMTGMVAIFCILVTLSHPARAAAPDFSLTGFAGVSGMGLPTTTGGASGAHVQVSTLAQLVSALQTNATLRVELMSDLDLSPMANHSGGFPSSYPVGEILVRSHKTIYSRNGSALRRGTLRIGKPSPGPQQNIIIRNLRFRDLWVNDPSGNYDTYGWDYIHIEENSHHIWIDHCDFGQSYDGVIDVTHGSDFITVSWNIFRGPQKKCSLVGHSENNSAEDLGHLNVTYHHNWFDSVEERIPRMRFGNAHVYNTYCVNLGGKGVQSTTRAATLVENSYFLNPESGSLPTVEVNGGGTGIVRVVNSVIVNRPGEDVQFRERGQSNFLFNAPFAGAVPPYSYSLDPVADVPQTVTNYAGVGKIGFELWQTEVFTSLELTNAAISGPHAAPAGDGVNNFTKYALGLPPRTPAVRPLIPLHLEDGGAVLTYTRLEMATDVIYRIESSTDLLVWSAANLAQQTVATNGGVQIREVRATGPLTHSRFFRVVLER